MIKITQLQNAEYQKQLEVLERERELLEKLYKEQGMWSSLKNRKMLFKDLHDFKNVGIVWALLQPRRGNWIQSRLPRDRIP